MKNKLIEIFPDYYLSENGFLFKNGVKVNQLKDKDGYLYSSVYIDGVRKQRYLAKLVAEHFVKNPNCYKFLIFKDGNISNISSKNLEYISNQQDAIKRKIHSKWHGTKIKYTKEHALENVKCPILKEYYTTKNIEIINKVVLDIYQNFKGDVSFLGARYLYLMDRIKNYSLMDDIYKFIRCGSLNFDKIEFINYNHKRIYENNIILK